MNKKMLVATALLGLASATSAFAAPTYYTSGAAFNAALSGTAGLTTNAQNFESPIAYAGVGTTINFTGGSLGNVAVSCAPTDSPNGCPNASTGGAFGINDFDSNYATSGNSVYVISDDSITFTFARAVQWFGIDIYDLGTIDPANLTMSLSNGASTTLFTNFFGADANRLFGGVSDSDGFTSVTFRGSVVNDFIAFDSATIAVPEPTSLALLGLGLMGVGAVRRRKA